ncbi:MAG TPA: HEPN domain-containing protein [Dehalococcoidia bacterium]|nr:HEPN domain-containing protein [Dehalococcoidia bacterium]
MQLDPQKVAEAREWLERASDDLREAEHDLTAAPPLVRGAVFHSQQAAEKAWKALLFWHDVPFRKTHDLRELGSVCTRLDGSLRGLADRAEDLTQFAWLFRYPGAPQAPPAEEAREALLVAREVYEAILARLPEEARP